MNADSAVAPVFDAAGPAAPQLPTGTDVMAREAMWWAWATRSAPPLGLASAGTGYDDEASVPLLPTSATVARGASLPYGTVDLLADLPYPHGRVTGNSGMDLTDRERLGHALVAAFSLHRREPGNVFNDHRGYASVRSRFPVSVLVREPGGSSVLDAYRHQLAPLTGAPGADGPDIVLTGRWARLPTAYRWFRGSLIGLETGIALRALHVATDLLGLSGWMRPPGKSGEHLLRDLGLLPARDWSLPVVVHLGTGRRRWPNPALCRAEAECDAASDTEDPVLDQVVAIDRTQRTEAVAAPVPGVPAFAPRTSGPSWGEVMWRRTSGRMPRGLYGMGGRPGPVSQEAVIEAAAWAAVPPPGALPTAAFLALTTTVVLQQVEGQVDGVYRIQDGALALLRPTRGVAHALEAEYGYPLAPGNGCDVRHAQAIWLLSVRPRELIDEHGPGAWTAVQHACGWIAHGLTLGAAAHGLYARPVRAFQETPVQRLVGLAPDEMVVLAVISGLPRHPIPLLDLRT